jgi:signal transduction histidine kinase/CheY-like chemotaxis protein
LSRAQVAGRDVLGALSTDEQAIKVEQIRIAMAALPKIVSYGAVAIVIMAGFCAYQARSTQDLQTIAMWAMAMCVVQVALYLFAHRFLTSTEQSAIFVLNFTKVLDVWITFAALMWGSPSWFLVKHDTLEQNALVIIVMAMILNGYATIQGAYRRGITLFTVPTVLTFVAGLLWAGGMMQYLFAVSYVVMGIAILDVARIQEGSVRRSIQFGIEADKLRAVAESASRAKTRFLASASHDLRQPIHTLALFVEALCLQPLNEATRTLAGHMRTATQALSTQLDALLDISKLDAGVVQVNATTLPLDGLMTRLRNEYLPAAQRKGLTLDWVGPAQACVQADPLHLERIVRNLIDNAIKYTDRGGVTASATRQADQWVLCVQDTGCGIAVHDQARVFEEFFQVGNPHRDRTLGMGLGLSIVARLAELQGIAIDLQSGPGLGTTFSLHLTAADQQAQVAEVAQPHHASLVGLHVLVVDDEQSVRLAMQSLLEGLGCVVHLASGLDGALAAPFTPGIALVDFRLAEGEDGISAIAQLRRHFPGLPALLISGDVAPERLRQASEAGLALLHKPVPLGKLVDAIRVNAFQG